MTETTEAAGLLRSGALYHRRLGLRPAAGELIFAGFKRGAFSVYFGDAPIYHFDLDGRWQRTFVAGVHYLKAPDGSVVAMDRVREGASLVLRRRPLGFAEAGDLDASIRRAAIELIDDLGAGRLAAVAPPEGVAAIAEDDLRAILDGVARRDAAAWFADRERYLATYGPLPFLPPDAPHPVILQATLGHADGLAFGGAAPAEHYVRSPAEFAAHARAVAALLGRRLLQCRSLFLGGPDLLRRPADDLAAYLETAAQVFPIDPDARRRRDLPDDPPRLDGICAFLDRFDAGLPDPAGYRRLRGLGLIRVALGVESGAPEVRATYGKSWADDALRAAVAGLTGAGIEANLVLLDGAGGPGLAGRHVAATADLVRSLDLAPGALIYLVDAAEIRGERPRAAPTGLREALAPARAGRGVKVVPYSLEKQSGSM